MKKLWLIAILFAVVLAGCGANPEGIEGTGTTADEVITTTETEATTTTITTSATPSTTSNPAAKIQQATTTRTEATKKLPEEKEIPIDVKVQNPFGEISFYKAKTGHDLQYVSIVFSYKLTADKRIYPVTVKAIDKNDNEYSMLIFGATPSKTFKNENGEIIGYEYDDTMGVFKKISDNIDLSHVTLTYAFEGYDPVTVEFDIPGL